jgi:hypothetical protein
MDIISVCNEIFSNKEKVFDDIREAFRFSQFTERSETFEDKSRAFAKNRRRIIIIVIFMHQFSRRNIYREKHI